MYVDVAVVAQYMSEDMNARKLHLFSSLTCDARPDNS